jgi:hypothetical protein
MPTLDSLRSRAAWLFMALLAVQVMILAGGPECVQPLVASGTTVAQAADDHAAHGSSHGPSHGPSHGSGEHGAPADERDPGRGGAHCDMWMACSGLMMAPAANAGRGETSPPIVRHMLLAEHSPSAAVLPPDTPPPRA